MEVVQAGEEGHGTDSDQEHFLERPIRHAGRMAFPGGIAEEGRDSPGHGGQQEPVRGLRPDPDGPKSSGQTDGAQADARFTGVHPGEPEGQPGHRKEQQPTHQQQQKIFQSRSP